MELYSEMNNTEISILMLIGIVLGLCLVIATFRTLIHHKEDQYIVRYSLNPRFAKHEGKGRYHNIQEKPVSSFWVALGLNFLNNLFYIFWIFG